MVEGTRYSSRAHGACGAEAQPPLPHLDEHTHSTRVRAHMVINIEPLEVTFKQRVFTQKLLPVIDFIINVEGIDE